MKALSDYPCNPTIQCPCKRRLGGQGFTYNAPPEGETRFDLKDSTYTRAYWACGVCKHQFADHNIDLSGLYGGAYVQQTYGDQMRANFDRILALPPSQSDNSGRVRRVLNFASEHFPAEHRPSLLDVGSGLGVFPFKIKEAGYDCTALDPDPHSCRHLVDVVGVPTVTADFLDIPAAELGVFDIITLNKVIEHVEDPVSMLRKARSHLNAGGLIYVEVPDVAAAVEGPEREEFYIEHHHVFSPASLVMTGERAGLDMLSVARLREPSGKYTLVMFAHAEGGISA